MRTKFKKLTSLCIVVIMILNVLTVAPLTAGASETDSASVGDTYTSGDFEYTVLDDGTAEISNYNGSEANLVIPNIIGGYKVTSVGERAFNYKSIVESVTIPYGVNTIGDLAFNNCSDLKNVTIPDSVTYIGTDAFSSSENLESITIPKGVEKIQSRTFWGCSGLKSVIISKGVKSIDSMAFQSCTSLESVIIPDGLTSIDFGAFGSCSSLKTITIPASVTYISSLSMGYNDYFMKVDGFTIEGYRGTAAEAYAIENGFEFIELGDIPTPSLGDVNGDGKVSIDDVTDIQKYIANTMDFTEDQMVLADVDKDGKVAIDDATLIQKHLVGMAVIE